MKNQNETGGGLLPAKDGNARSLAVAAGSALNAALQLKADMFDYLCWLEDFCQFRQAALDGQAGDYLVLASDGTTCFAKTYAEAVRVAMEHDKELHDATEAVALPNDPDEQRHE